MRGDHPARLRPIDGLRALSVLWVIGFHLIYLLGAFVAPAEYRALVDAPLAGALARGHLGVDVFFVISGLLIGRLLLDEVARSGTIAVRRFYLRRLFRIVPAYQVVLGVTLLVAQRERWQSAWANLLFVNNYLPSDRQAMGWSWSLAIEEQFYVLLPWLVLALHRWTRRPLTLLALALAAAFVVRAAVLAHYDLTGPIPAHPALGEERFRAYFDHVYQPLHTRFGGLLCGAIAAYAIREGSPVHAWLTRAVWRLPLLLAVSLAGLAVMVTERSLLTSHPLPYLIGYRYVFAMLVAGVALPCLLAPGPVAWVLAWAGWRPVAELSYGAYLVHPLVIGIGYHALFRPDHVDPPRLALYAVYALLVSFGLAWALHRWIEAPCRDFGRRLAGAGSVSAARRRTR